jgi:hypothetical protein
MVKTNNLSDVSDQQTALNNVTNVWAATNEYVLTKDTATGDAIFKEPASSWHTIQDEWISLSQRTKLNFIWDNVTVTDNAWADSTDVTITTTALVDSYTTTNVTTDRTLDADNTTIDELADVLWTVIEDMQQYSTTSNINDWVTSLNSTWSSTKINTELGNKVDTSSLATVATTGSYNDLWDKPTIPSDDSEISAAASATNYTPTTATVEWHLAWIDTALWNSWGWMWTEIDSATLSW